MTLLTINKSRCGVLTTVALGSLLTIAACGGSSGGKQTPVTKAQAQAIANKINLTTTDLPGYTSSPNTETAKDKANDATLSKCTGTTPDTSAFLNAESPDFDKGSTEVSSQVEVLPSASDVKHDLKVIQTSHAQQCVANELTPILKAISGVSNLKIHMAPISEPSTGTSGAFGLAAQISLTAGGAQHNLTQTLVGFGRGNVQFALSVQTVGNPPAGMVSKLLKTLVTRADANVPDGGLKPTS
jgi:hypothetical protein